MTRPLSTRVAVALAAALIVLLLAEMGFRLFEEDEWYERVGSPHVVEDPFMPRDLLEDHHEKTGHRLLFFGDSFTYGSGVQKSETFVELVSGNRGVRPSLDCFNAGIPGSNPVQWERLSGDLLDALLPDAVIVVFFMRDGADDLYASNLIDRVRGQMVALQQDSFLFRTSAIWRHVTTDRLQRQFSREHLGLLNDAYVGGPRDVAEWKYQRAALGKIFSACRAREIQIGFVLFPVLFQLDDHHPLHEAMEEVEGFVSSQDVPFLSLFPAFHGMDPASLWVSPQDSHPNPAAHRIAADVILDFAKEELIGH